MTRRIFRPSAVRRYNERLEKVELPRYATAPWTLLLWLGVLLLLLTAALLLAVRLPQLVSGQGVVVAAAPGDSTELVALLPAESASRLRPGQTAAISLPAAGASPLPATVTAVAEEPLSAADARAQYGLAPHGPVVAARVSVILPGDELLLGSVGEVEITVGSRTILSLLPGLAAREAGIGENQ